jgi:biopolymer transport protein ExbB/TolQ
MKIISLNQNSAKSELMYQLLALLIVTIVVHAAYVTIIRPQAASLVAEQLARQEAGETYEAQRSVFIILKDLEQEACFILMLWAMLIMYRKSQQVAAERSIMERSLLEIPDGTRVLPEDARQLARPIEALSEEEQDWLPARAVSAALLRFASTRDIGSVSTAIRQVCDSHSERLDSELSMIRYIGWAIPSIGFIGTVRGIGDALGKAHEAVAGNISGVAASLGVAFNSTFVALLLSIVLMFFMHQLQLQQERLVLDTEKYCDRKLLRFLKVVSE